MAILHLVNNNFRKSFIMDTYLKIFLSSTYSPCFRDLRFIVLTNSINYSILIEVKCCSVMIFNSHNMYLPDLRNKLKNEFKFGLTNLLYSITTHNLDNSLPEMLILTHLTNEETVHKKPD